MSKELDIKAPDGNIYTISVNDDVSDNDALQSFAAHYKQNMEQGGKPAQPSGAVDTLGNKALRATKFLAGGAGMLGKDAAQGGIGAITGIPELLMRGYNMTGLPQIPETSMPSTAVQNALSSPEIEPQTPTERMLSHGVQAATSALTGGAAGNALVKTASAPVRTAGKVLGGGLSPASQVTPMVLGSAAADVARESGNPGLALPASLIGSMSPSAIRMMGSGVAGNVGQRVLGETGIMGAGAGTGSNLVNNAALGRLAQLLQREAPNADPLEFARGRLDQLGNRGSLANIGQNTLSEADLLASLPGNAKPMFRQEAERVAGTRGPTLQAAADQALGTSGANLGEWVNRTISDRNALSKPLYDQLNGVQVPVDTELQKLLQRSVDAHSLAEKSARIRGEPVDLSEITAGARSVPFSTLDKVKQSLYDAAQSAKRSGANNLGNDFDNLRQELIQKLDKISPKDANGVSIYKQAREAFAGPSQLADAAEAGSKAVNQDERSLKDLISGMSQGELEAFKIGAAQSFREKLGSQSGQTQLMAFLKNPNTSDRINLIFGDKADDFKRALLREADVKQIERVGQGSQTMPRSALAEDQGVSLDAVQAVSALHNPVNAISALAKGTKYLTMPEVTRNKLAEMLLARGDAAESQLKDLQKYMAEQAMSSAQRKRLAGVLAARNVAQAGQE
jgi:hypothetical protein